MKQIPGFPNYCATEDGRIWSKPRAHTKGGFLKQGKDGGGYAQVNLQRDGKQFTRLVHHLVALTFLGPRPVGMEVRHIDGRQVNNTVRNLEYGASSENTLDTVAHGTHNEARKTHCPHGHEYTTDNTRTCVNKRRYCRQCDADRHQAARARRAAARK